MKKPKIRTTDLPAARIQNLKKVQASLTESKMIRPVPLAAAIIAPFAFGEDLYNAAISLLIGSAAYAATYIYGPMIKTNVLANFNNLRHGREGDSKPAEKTPDTPPE